MGNAEIVRISCSSCRTKIPTEDIFAKRAIFVGQYCFCSKCMNENQLREIRRIRKLSADERTKESRKNAVFYNRR